MNGLVASTLAHLGRVWHGAQVEPTAVRGGGIRAKGSNFVGFREAIRTVFGEDTWQRVLDAAGDEGRELFRDGRLKAGSWYPVAPYRALHTAAAETLPTEPDLARRIGHAAMTSDLSGIYRVLCYFLSPHSLIARAAPIFGTYWEGAQLTIQRISRSHARVDLAGCEGFDQRIWSDIFGGITASLEHSGALDVVVDVLDGCGEDSFCRIDVSWQNSG